MLLKPKETTVAYRCPACGGGVMAPVGVFSLTAERMKLNCPCGGSSMLITVSGDDMVRLDLPCFACGSKHHNYKVSREVFFSRELFSLSCSMSGIDVCWFGKEEKVSRALSEQEEELKKMIGGENGGNDSTPGISPEEDTALRRISDADVYNVIMYLIAELKEENKLFCACPPGKCEPDVDLSDDGRSLRVFCKKCGREKFFPMSSVSDADTFLALDEITLE